MFKSATALTMATVCWAAAGHAEPPDVLVGNPGVLLVAADSEDASPDSAWMGVQLTPVPAAAAMQLNLDKEGVMVRNVFKDSPADKAGLQRYDIITKADGQAVDRGVDGFSRHVRGKQPDDTLNLQVLRKGAPIDLAIKLGKTPSQSLNLELKYEDDPDVSARRMFGMRGKILRPGPHGWTLDDLGELPDAPEMWERFLNHSQAADEPVDESNQPADKTEIQESRRVSKDGDVLQVRRNSDGTVEVRRHKRDRKPADADITTYKNMEELLQNDPEAAKLLQAASRPSGGAVHREPGTRDLLRRYPHDDVPKRYLDALGEYWKKYGHWPPPGDDGDKLREFNQRLFPTPAPEIRRLPLPPPEPPRVRVETRAGRPPEARPPQTSFDVKGDGSISVEVQDGPTQLRMTFPNEESMKQQAPKLFDQYQCERDKLR